MEPKPPDSRKPVVGLDELTERIRAAAQRENGLLKGASKLLSSTSDLPPVPESLLPPSAPVDATGNAGAARRPETLLDEAASMLLGGRKKNTVPGSVPRLLRQFFRNQGGYNSVLLEAVERLLDVNRTLRRENSELHDQIMELHTWAHSVAQTSAENRDWTLVADARLRSFTEGRLSQLETRLAGLEKQNGPVESGDSPQTPADSP